MADLNSCSFTGRIVRDTQMVQSGKMAYTSIAIGSFRKDGDDYVEETTFLDIKFLGEVNAKRAVENLKKGKAVWLAGELKSETKENVTRYGLIVSRFSLLPLNRREDSQPKNEEKKEEAPPPKQKTQDENIPF